MLKLKNVSKFYYSHGVVTSGFTKVNLEFEKGEFVAITGESGSGKSTLLNVISGLDTYEEGEMYINGEETSAYSNADFENYRRKYIANIYQSFNLINSYTVYQNIEMVLLLSRMKRKERKAKILDVLEKVGLSKFRRQRASRLSGGQKQRVAIARALVKDTPIIVADEPTGNLDSESAANVIKLLSELAADRLVIVVTHNYDQVEPYVTRKITMHDGRVTEDLKFDRTAVKETKEDQVSEGSFVTTEEDMPEGSVTSGADASGVTSTASSDMQTESKEKYKEPKNRRMHLNLISRLRLGIRNTFNLIPKFLLLLFIFLFVSVAVTSLYTNLRKQDHDSGLSGDNYFFQNKDEHRVVIKKEDGSPITAEDFESLTALSNVRSVFKDDVLLDNQVNLQHEDNINEKWYYLNGYLTDINGMGITDEDLTYGRMPTEPNEVIVVGPEEYYYNTEETANDVFTCPFDLWLSNVYSETPADSGIMVTGFLFKPMDRWEFQIGVYPEVFEKVKMGINSGYSNMKINVAGREFQSDQWSQMNKVIPSYKVGRGQALVSADWNYYWDWQWAPGQCFNITVSNLYYTDTKCFRISDVYYSWNFTEKTGYSDYSWNNGIILINPADYQEFFDKDCYQSSIFVEDPEKVQDTLSSLKEMGYVPLYIQDSLIHYDRSWMAMNEIFTTLWSSALVIVLFFISYFIIKLIMRSRNVYFATVRMLGGSAGDCRSLIKIELLLVLNLAFFLMIGALYAAHLGYYEFSFVSDILHYLKLKDYIVLYVVLNLMSLIISSRYSRQLFKTSAMNVYKEV